MNCVNGYYYIIYFLALLASLLLISPQLFKLSQAGPDKQKKWAKRILFCLPIYLIIFSYGSIVDAIFPMTIIWIANLLLSRKFPSNTAAASMLSGKYLIPLVAILSFLADMTRPYAPYILLLMLAASATQRNWRAIAGLALGLALALPYHTIQYKAIGSPILTNYTGCNLIEVFKAPGATFAGSMVTTPQIEIAKRCKENSQRVKNYILTQPLNATKDFLSPIRLMRTVWPAPFTPWQYETSPGFGSAEEIAQWALWAALIIFLYIPITQLVVSAFKKMFLGGAQMALLSSAIFLPLVFSAIAHGGQEAGRVGMAFVLPITFYAAYMNARISSHRLEADLINSAG